MQTIAQIKDNLAQERGYPSWPYLLADCFYNDLDSVLNEVIRRCQNEAVIEYMQKREVKESFVLQEF